MNYVKKMCILRQIRQGFSADGNALSGLIKVEQYGKNLAVEVSIINFAPLSSGDYYCLLSDGKGKTEMLLLRGKSLFNILTDMDVSGGFCGIVCHVKNEVVPIAYGINGNGNYDWRAILNATLPPVFPKKKTDKAAPEIAETISPPPEKERVKETATNERAKHSPTPLNEDENTPYNDETVATENYYEEKEDERQQPKQARQNAHDQGTVENAREEEGTDPSEDGNAPRVLHPFATDPDGYYLSVKGEIDELFRNHPRDTALCAAFSCSEWVRIKGEESAPQYLVGVLYEDGKAKYICYALAADDPDTPPEEIKEVCTFVPSTPYREDKGFFVIFQSASSGECIKPQKC